MSRMLLAEVLVLVGAVVPIAYFAAPAVQEIDFQDAGKGEPRMTEEWKLADDKRLEERAIDLLADYYQQKHLPSVDLKVISRSTAHDRHEGRRIKLLVEFTKEVNERDWLDRFDRLANVHAEISHIDDEAVRIGKTRVNIFRIETDGEVTFKRGERFRVYLPLSVHIDSNLLSKTRRAEIRLHVGNDDRRHRDTKGST